MPYTSTVPAAKTALMAVIALQDEVANNGVPVLRREPTDEAQWGGKSELIHLGTVEQSEEWFALGAQRRDEEYTIEVVVMVHAIGGPDGAEATEERAWVLRDAIAQAVHSDPLLGGVLNQRSGIESSREETTPFADGWGTRLTLTIRCNARI